MAHAGGRPTDYTDELAFEICEEIENSVHGVKVLCEKNKHWPTSRTVQRWTKNNEKFCRLYALAKERQADYMADEMIEVAYDDKRDWRTIVDENGKEKTVFVPEAVNRSRLKIDTLKWQAARLAPKKYCEKQETINHHHVGMKEVKDNEEIRKNFQEF